MDKGLEKEGTSGIDSICDAVLPQLKDEIAVKARAIQGGDVGNVISLAVKER